MKVYLKIKGRWVLFEKVSPSEGFEQRDIPIEDNAEMGDREEEYEVMIGVDNLVRIWYPKKLSTKSLQKWEGAVFEVRDDSFLASLVDLTYRGNIEHAEILIEKVSKEDRHLIEIGAIFDWDITDTTSIIRFRRLPAWQKNEIEKAQHEAEQIQKSIIKEA